jgi:transposase-like protein
MKLFAIHEDEQPTHVNTSPSGPDGMALLPGPDGEQVEIKLLNRKERLAAANEFLKLLKTNLDQMIAKTINHLISKSNLSSRSSLTCPACKATMRTAVPVEIGRKVRCPKCNATFLVDVDKKEYREKKQAIDRVSLTLDNYKNALGKRYKDWFVKEFDLMVTESVATQSKDVKVKDLGEYAKYMYGRVQELLSKWLHTDKCGQDMLSYLSYKKSGIPQFVQSPNYNKISKRKFIQQAKAYGVPPSKLIKYYAGKMPKD